MIRKLLLATTAAATLAGAAPAATILNGSFEQPDLGTGEMSYQYNPTTPGWTFLNSAGIAYAQSAWHFQAAPDGTQVAFLQGAGSTASQTVTGLDLGRTYYVTFQVAHRPGYGVNPIVVTFDGATIHASTPTADAWTGIQTARFTATGATGLLSFTGTNAVGDNDTGIDDVAIASVPEPTTWAMLVLGFGLIGAGARRRKATPRTA